METIGKLVLGLAQVLKDALGIDITKYVAWLGLLFSPEATKKTQRVRSDWLA
jgi:hypothetical protein